jgi:hypothetical protein
MTRSCRRSCGADSSAKGICRCPNDGRDAGQQARRSTTTRSSSI